MSESFAHLLIHSFQIMTTKDIHQIIAFPTTALDLYQCIMDERKHSSFTGSEAIIEDKEGSTFTAYDGYIEGRNVVLERGKKIVQTWKANEEEWPDNHTSEVVFIFTDTPSGGQIEFFQTAIPAAIADNIEKGWTDYYWEPLKFYLER